MALRLTLKPNEKIVINGCVIRNADRRQTLTIENYADVVRGSDLLDEAGAATPVKKVYFFIQSALLRPEIRDDLTPVIQKSLAELVPIFNERIAGHIFEAANHVSTANYYKALRALREVMRYEDDLMALLARPRDTLDAAE
ncbi:flagellar biosynthesis repressor FlbT [Antarcticimicrobium sediminis]|uniref:Flagellum biosynthesis protein FlbT n=1 Tax=Antarcticimicrobium sediminis TaxID=2546227 RepID=A0A4R5EVQ6_9RHOB|nr:flagellar biosynthesis repressor FlbT [Antarcticimicrobium sediminis]TDE38910.1 flagellum biosynthesis protein FlbT [Antarcticimicrobium sediminis]